MKTARQLEEDFRERLAGMTSNHHTMSTEKELREELLREIRERMPEEKEMALHKCGFASCEHYPFTEGYNTCRTQALQVLDEVENLPKDTVVKD